MYKELEMWKAENAKHAETLREEERYVLRYTIPSKLAHMYFCAYNIIVSKCT